MSAAQGRLLKNLARLAARRSGGERQADGGAPSQQGAPAAAAPAGPEPADQGTPQLQQQAAPAAGESGGLQQQQQQHVVQPPAVQHTAVEEERPAASMQVQQQSQQHAVPTEQQQQHAPPQQAPPVQQAPPMQAQQPVQQAPPMQAQQAVPHPQQQQQAPPMQQQQAPPMQQHTQPQQQAAPLQQQQQQVQPPASKDYVDLTVDVDLTGDDDLGAVQQAMQQAEAQQEAAQAEARRRTLPSVLLTPAEQAQRAEAEQAQRDNHQVAMQQFAQLAPHQQFVYLVNHAQLATDPATQQKLLQHAAGITANLAARQHVAQQAQQQQQQPFNPLMTAHPLPQQQQAPDLAAYARRLLGDQVLAQPVQDAFVRLLAHCQSHFHVFVQHVQQARQGQQAQQAQPAQPAQPVPSSYGVVTKEDMLIASKAIAASMHQDETQEEEPPPGLMLTPLLRHQRIALAWMHRREEKGSMPIGGILADDQGLGKTVSTISLIVKYRPRAGNQGQPAPGPGRAGSSASLAQLQERSNGRKRPRSSPAAGGGGKGKGARDGSSSSSSSESSSSESSSSSDESSSSESESESDRPAPSGSPNDVYPSTSSQGGSGAAANGTGGAAAAAAAGAEAAAAAAASEDETMSTDDDELDEDAIGLPMGGTLVVCPTTVLHQWASEIKTKINQNAGINVHVYHGKGKGLSAQTLSRYGVVLTTYATMALEAPRREGAGQKGGKKPVPPGTAAAAAAGAAGAAGSAWGEEDGVVDLISDSEEAGPSSAQQPAAKRQKGAGGKAAAGGGGRSKEAGPLHQIYWHRVVLDEAQCIKNPRTLAAHAAWTLKARSRWCLSGTPLQNSLDDLYSYFRFLRYQPWSDHAKFKALLKDPVEKYQGELGAKALERLKTVLQVVMMRRTKDSKIGERPIVDLPPRLQQLVKTQFSPAEQQFYEAIKTEAGQELRRLQAEGATGGQQYVGVLWQFLRMRQACNHPLLVKGASHGHELAAAEIAAAKRLPADVRRRLAEALQPRNLRECVVCGDVPEDPLVSVCSHIYCAECFGTELSKAGQGAVEAELAYSCPHCGHTLGKHDTFSAAALAKADPALAQQAQQAQQQQGDAGASGSGSEVAKWETSAKLEALMEILKKLRDKGAAAEAEVQQRRSVLNAGRSVSHARLAAALGGGGSRGPTRGAGSGGASRGASPRLPMEKVIVFSQWTAMLDLAEGPLRKAGFNFRRLDGTMSIKARQQAIEDFSRKPDVGVMLVSLKAASLGVNLVCANHVVLLDLWYNPTVEEQAIDRAHRIGQTKPVHVTRITIEGSIEDKILELQDRKRSMISSTLTEKGGKYKSQAEILDLMQDTLGDTA